MAFTRKMLKALGIDDEKIEQIMDAHTEVTDVLKSERDKYKGEAEKAGEMQSELDKAKKDLENADKNGSSYKTKYETEKAEHDKLKSEIADKETAAKKDSALIAWLKEKGYSENGAKKIAKYGGFRDRITLGEDGKATNLDELADDVAAEWGEYKGEPKTESYKGSDPVTGGSAPKKNLAAQYYAEYQNRLYGKNSAASSNDNGASDTNKEG